MGEAIKGTVFDRRTRAPNIPPNTTFKIFELDAGYNIFWDWKWWTVVRISNDYTNEQNWTILSLQSMTGPSTRVVRLQSNSSVYGEKRMDDRKIETDDAILRRSGKSQLTHEMMLSMLDESDLNWDILCRDSIITVRPKPQQTIKVKINRQQHDMAYEDEQENGDTTIAFYPKMVRSDDYEQNK